MKKSQREKRERARKERRQQEAEERAAAAAVSEDDDDAGVDDGDVDVDVDVDIGEDRLPDSVLRALASRDELRGHAAGEDGDGDEGEDGAEDHRALQRRIVSQQLRALSTKSSNKRKFGKGRAVGSGIVVKSLKGELGSARASGAAASRAFLQSRLGRHAREVDPKRGSGGGSIRMRRL